MMDRVLVVCAMANNLDAPTKLIADMDAALFWGQTARQVDVPETMYNQVKMRCAC